ncbi:hypothetical protein M8C21_014113, partial [Ambrosia artemisiifolia]
TKLRCTSSGFFYTHKAAIVDIRHSYFVPDNESADQVFAKLTKTQKIHSDEIEGVREASNIAYMKEKGVDPYYLKQ